MIYPEFISKDGVLDYPNCNKSRLKNSDKIRLTCTKSFDSDQSGAIPDGLVDFAELVLTDALLENDGRFGNLPFVHCVV